VTRKAPKLKNVVDLVQQCIESGRYLYTDHALVRMQGRDITRNEVKQVLLAGYREPRKDQYDEQWEAWKYAFNGLTIDRRRLRIVVAFGPDKMLVVTAIALS